MQIILNSTTVKDTSTILNSFAVNHSENIVITIRKTKILLILTFADILTFLHSVLSIVL